MRISINKKVVDYRGPGCYNLNTGKRVIGGHLHNDGKNGIEYIDLNAEYNGQYSPTHEVDLPDEPSSFVCGFATGIGLALVVIISIFAAVA